MTAPGRTRKVVLIVDDEPLLRMTAMDVVEEAGLDAVAAADTAEAIYILERRTDIGIVFSDIDMPPGPDGLKLAAHIRVHWPAIGLILTSGKLPPRPQDLPDGGLFFTKPYKEQDVITALRRMAH